MTWKSLGDQHNPDVWRSCEIDPLPAAKRQERPQERIQWNCQLSKFYSLLSQSINLVLSNWERKKDIRRGVCGVVNSQNFISSGRNQSCPASRWPNLPSFVIGKWRQWRQGTSVTDKEAVNASLRGFLVFSSTQVTSLQPAFKIDLSLLCPPFYSERNILKEFLLMVFALLSPPSQLFHQRKT